MPSTALTAWVNHPRTPRITDVVSNPWCPEDEDSEPLKRLQGKKPSFLSHREGHSQNPTFVPQYKSEVPSGRGEKGEGMEVGGKMRAGRKPNLGNTAQHSLTS